MDIGLFIPANLSKLIAEVMKVVDIGMKIPATLPKRKGKIPERQNVRNVEL